MTNLDEFALRVVRDGRAILERALPKLAQGMFEKLDDALFQMVEKSESNSKQLEFMAAMREARKSRQLVQDRFLHTVLSGYDRFWTEGPAALQGVATLAEASSELSLVEETELEESLAVTSMAARGEGNFSKDLFSLASRYGHLLKQEGLEEHHLPVAPLAIANGFRSAMQAFPSTIDIKLVVFKLFEKEVIAYLGGVYDELNTALAQAGVLPKLPQKMRKNPVAPAIRRTQEEGSRAEDYAGADSTFYYEGENAEGAGEVFDALRQLLGGRPASGGLRTQGYVPALPVIGAMDLLGALSNIQHGAHTASTFAEEALLDDIKNVLLRRFAIGEGDEAQKSIGRAEEDVIDVISMLFEFILEDPALPDHLKVLLGKLQIPMLKVAILDKEFFAKKNHPARRLLNRLAQASVSLDASIPRDQDPLYQRIEATVRRILDEFDDDPAIFAALYQEFSSYLDAEETRSRALEERSAQVIQGKERLDGARNQVENEIERRLQGMSLVPDAVLLLLRGPWRDVLSLILLRNGVESDEWRAALAQMDKLIWSVTPKSNPAERKKLLSEIPLILKDLREQLEAISYDQRLASKIYQALQAAHIACLRNEQPKAQGVLALDLDSTPASIGGSTLVVGSAQEEEELESILQLDDPVNAAKRPHPLAGPTIPLEGVVEVVHDQFQQQAEQLAVGTWFEFRYPGSEMQRLKLSWRSAMTDLCVFVNRKGMKAREMRVPEIAKGLREFRMRVVEAAGAPQLVDRALTAMVEALKRGEGPPQEKGQKAS